MLSEVRTLDQRLTVEAPTSGPALPKALAKCRGCGAQLKTTFIDLGSLPLSNSYVSAEDQADLEPTYPLHALVCDGCHLVQLDAYSSREHIFGHDYAYFSSYSDTWLAHARAYADMAINRFSLGPRSRVFEIASNDGYLLQYFVNAGVPVLGIDPAENVAYAARARGVPTQRAFFGEAVARDLKEAHSFADLIIANNVLAHVPDLDDFLAGIAALLGPAGWATFEFPHILELIRNTEFDTIYHEHYSYFSLHALEPIFARHELEVVDATQLSTHGGSLRLFIRHCRHADVSENVATLRSIENLARLDDIDTYAAFPAAVEACRTSARDFFAGAGRSRKRVIGYGAPAKGNTFLNYCGIDIASLPFTVDRNAYKVGKLLPGTRIPIRPVTDLADAQPDYVLILPWNLRDEIEQQLATVRKRAKFVTAIPKISIR